MTYKVFGGTLNLAQSITPVLCELHWLPIRERVKFKLAYLVRQSLFGQATLYLADDC